ncbi:MAG TPA: tail fiber protein [Xanthobacteraceae bacterium]|jgi:microcystin-dependent protein|nr:tail fiber protein [Xanthobacteraceae bacterium]
MDPYVAEIRIFPFNFAPKGWAFCDGQLLPISQNAALFSLLGTFYGGDGKSTFALPNLQGRVAISQGQLDGGSQYFLGEQGGSDTVTLLSTELPSHNHTVNATTVKGSSNDPGNNMLCEGQYTTQTASGPVDYYGPDTAATKTMNPQMIAPSGNSFPHNNMMPYLTLSYCIALQGVYPPRS